MNHSFLKRNGLLLVFLTLTLFAIAGQSYTGWQVHNEERIEKGFPTFSFNEYLVSGHFLQSTFENWESEFLQMAMYVVMTVFLFQQGSAESKSLDGPEPVDRPPQAHQDAPWPVKQDGIVLMVYQNSLSLIFILLFIASFLLHAHGTMLQMNEEDGTKLSIFDMLKEQRFWFESFQNWQSEFLSVAAIVFFSIYLRQKGSPESKPVDAPHTETGG